MYANSLVFGMDGRALWLGVRRACPDSLMGKLGQGPGTKKASRMTRRLMAYVRL